MHELAIVESVVDAICEELAGEQIACVRLEIGLLADVDLDALHSLRCVQARNAPRRRAALDSPHRRSRTLLALWR